MLTILLITFTHYFSYLYFTEYIGGIYPGIFRCYLDGSNRDTVFSTDQIQPITGLSIDNVRNIIYWTQGSELKSLNIWEFENSTSVSRQGQGSYKVGVVCAEEGGFIQSS